MREIAVLQCAFATGQSDCHDGICPSPLAPPDDNEAISQLFPDLRQCLGTASRLEGIINILLAVVAGVLLFGREAMTSGLQRFAVVAVAIFAIHLVLIGVRAILSWIGTEWRAAGNTEERLSITFATAAGCTLVPLAPTSCGCASPVRRTRFRPLRRAGSGGPGSDCFCS